MMPSILLALAAVIASWTTPSSWPLLCTSVAGLAAALLHLPGSRGGTGARWLTPVGLWVLLGLVTGWDRGQAVTEVALAVLVLTVLLAAAARAPDRRAPALLSAGISLLSLWALWQVAVGFHLARAGISSLPEGLQAAVRFRLDSGRAFASQLHPGHLAVLLATAVTLAGGFLFQGRRRLAWAAILILATIGLALTRSPLGLGLSLLALLAVLPGGSARLPRLIVLIFAGVLAGIILLRPDVFHLEPLLWRLGNWRNALWVWTRSPITGAGLGGFGQAALAVPFPVPNHPQHAHCLPLEWLAEMGIPGLVLAVLFYAWIFGLARRLWERHRPLAVAMLVIPLHNLADFSLFEPGIAIVWAVLAGWGVAAAREDLPHPAPSRRPRLAILAGCLAVAFFGLQLASQITSARAAAASGPQVAFRTRLLAYDLAPWQPFPPTLARAVRSASRERADLLANAVAHARWWRPHSAAVAALASELAARRGRLPQAARAAWEARVFLALDRRPRPPRTGGHP